MPGKTVYKENPDFEKEFDQAAESMQAMAEVAEGIASEARELAPVDSTDYRDSIEGGAKEGASGAEAVVSAADFKAHWIEFGTGHPGPTPAFGTLTNAAEAYGARVERER